MAEERSDLCWLCAAKSDLQTILDRFDDSGELIAAALLSEVIDVIEQRLRDAD